MTLFRLRTFGDAEWTEIYLDGDLEESVGEALLAALSDQENLHIQQKALDGEWEDCDWEPLGE